MKKIKFILIGAFYLILLSANAQHADFSDVDFSKADSVADLYRGYELNQPDKLAEMLSKDLPTETEKFRAIFYWITKNVSYDCSLYEKMEAKKQKAIRNKKKVQAIQSKYWRKSYRRTIKKKLAICAGYSLLLKYMCDQAGLSSVMVSGYSRNYRNKFGKGSIDHAWNAVQLNNKWYLCDVTWASGYCDDRREKFAKKFDKVYFLSDPTLFIANHFPADTTWTLLYDKPTLQEFFSAPYKGDAYLSNKINTYFPKEGVQRIKQGQTFNFKFTSNQRDISRSALLTMERVVPNAKDKPIEIRKELKQNAEGQYVLSHEFLEKGNFYVDIDIDGALTFEYRVVVY